MLGSSKQLGVNPMKKREQFLPWAGRDLEELGCLWQQFTVRLVYLWGGNHSLATCLDQNNFKILSLDLCTGASSTEGKTKRCTDFDRISTHMKNCRVQPCTLHTLILPSLPETILLIVLRADAVCWKPLTHLTISEMLSKIPWWLPLSRKFRNVKPFRTAWAGAGC